MEGVQLTQERLPDSLEALVEKVKNAPVDAIFGTSCGVALIQTRVREPSEINCKTFTVASGGVLTDLDESKINQRTIPTSYGLVDSKGNPGGGKAVAITVAFLLKFLRDYQQNVDNIYVVPNSTDIGNRTKTSDAEAMETYLKGLRVKNNMILEKRSLDTFTELLEAIRMAIEKNWKHIVIPIRSYQLPRAEAMMYSILNINDESEKKKIEQVLAFNVTRSKHRRKDHEHFADSKNFLVSNFNELGGIEVSFVKVEEALGLRDKRYEKLLEEVYKMQIEVEEPDLEDPTKKIKKIVKAYEHNIKLDLTAAEQWSKKGTYGLTEATKKILPSYHDGTLFKNEDFWK